VSGAGYHFGLTRDHAKRVFAATDDAALLALAEEFKNSKEMKKNGQVVDCKKWWDPIHRCLTEGELDPEGGEIPLNHAILGGKQLAKGTEYFISLVRPDLTPFVAEALHDLKEPEFRQRYFQLADKGYTQALNEKEYALVWHQIQELRNFFEYCAEERFAVLFIGQRAG
jgi:hypothetical protein